VDRAMKKITASSYKKDKYYKSVTNAVHELLKEKLFVAPVDLFMQMGKLSKEDYEDWRFRRIPHLEKVLNFNLSKANRILRILKHHAEALGLKPSRTVYMKWGKGKKRITLRFSKFSEHNVELSYSTHYIATSMKHYEMTDKSPQKSEEPDELRIENV
jgi:hypothetical protein